MRNALILGVVVLVALIVAVAGFKLSGWRLTREQARTEQARDMVAGATLTVEGTRELTAAADRLASATLQLRNATNAQDRAAYADPLASDVLPDSVRARVGADDVRLCASVACTRPDGPAATAGPAR